ncbi:MAG: hypothetical protein ONB44_00570 [candidate division KSB1 bacterium]|nr:hypothetical protein [candidate division KSB1 bacterium]MDZ7300613.1 hypothetical protein [candidate division KSB1 bacterium]MDZ7309750.1 hypothetical protein [candidate division KSB1 bacterium]
MKKMVSKSQSLEDSDMLPEYDFRGGVRGKHYKAYRRGHTVKIHKADGTISIQYFKPEEGAVMLEPDVLEYFPDSEAVNEALRALIKLIPKPREKQKNNRTRKHASLAGHAI